MWDANSTNIVLIVVSVHGLIAKNFDRLLKKIRYPADLETGYRKHGTIFYTKDNFEENIPFEFFLLRHHQHLRQRKYSHFTTVLT